MILIQNRDCPFWACLYTSLGYFRHVSGKNTAAQPIYMINILKELVSHHGIACFCYCFTLPRIRDKLISDFIIFFVQTFNK